MADVFPPDRNSRAGKRGADKSGKVADFRYRNSSQPNGHKPDAHPSDGRKAQGRKKNRRKSKDGARREGNAQGRTQRAHRSGAGHSAHGKAGKFARAGPRRAYAALDLGTNNCRLLIARPTGGDFTVIDAFSRVVRLGEGLAQSGRLSDAAMERTLGALQICANKLQRRNVHLARSVATEACRRAANGTAFIEQVRRETGIVLDIISAEEEARLAVLGCHILLEGQQDPAVIFDIGGGSTELVLIEPSDNAPRILDWQSVPWGVVSLTDTVGRSEFNDDERLARYAEMRHLVRESFDSFARRIARYRGGDSQIRLLGTSGTVTTLASLHLQLPRYDRRAVDGLIVPSQSMRSISQNLSTMSFAERGELPCIGQDRADLVVAGCAILESIMDIWPAEQLGIADRGIREGILRSMMATDAAGEHELRHLHGARNGK